MPVFSVNVFCGSLFFVFFKVLIREECHGDLLREWHHHFDVHEEIVVPVSEEDRVFFMLCFIAVGYLEFCLIHVRDLDIRAACQDLFYLKSDSVELFFELRGVAGWGRGRGGAGRRD